MTRIRTLAAVGLAALALAGCAEEPGETPAPEPAPASEPGEAPGEPIPPSPAEEPEAPRPARPPAPAETREALAPEPAPDAAEALPAEPPASLDLEQLRKRLEKTSALGALTKLKLRNELDDLRAALRAHRGGSPNPSLAALRERYDLLLMKLLSLLEERDAALSRDLYASRDAVWNALYEDAAQTRAGS